jgi:hypothetical protein
LLNLKRKIEDTLGLGIRITVNNRGLLLKIFFFYKTKPCRFFTSSSTPLS